MKRKKIVGAFSFFSPFKNYKRKRKNDILKKIIKRRLKLQSDTGVQLGCGVKWARLVKSINYNDHLFPSINKTSAVSLIFKQIIKWVFLSCFFESFRINFNRILSKKFYLFFFFFNRLVPTVLIDLFVTFLYTFFFLSILQGI